MNYQRLSIATVAGFLFIFTADFLIHGIMLSDSYSATAEVWRPVDEMKMSFMLVSQIGQALFVSLLCASLYQANIISKYLNGTLFGLMMGVMAFGQYSFLPIPLSLSIYWAIAGFVEGYGIWVINSFIYKEEK